MLVLTKILAASASLFVLTPEAPTVVQAPVAERPDPEYQACIASVEEDIESGRKKAMKWASEGGGAPAQHCLAVADLAAGFPKLAAIRLEELADRDDAGDDLVRARILSEAALAWIEAGLPDHAQAAVDKAFTYAPEAGELYLTEAKVDAAKNRQQATIDAVTKAEQHGVVSADGYVLRGRAYYALAEYHKSAEDAVAALKIDPFNVDALVLRGDLIQQGIEIKANYQRAPNDSAQ